MSASSLHNHPAGQDLRRNPQYPTLSTTSPYDEHSHFSSESDADGGVVSQMRRSWAASHMSEDEGSQPADSKTDPFTYANSNSNTTHPSTPKTTVPPHRPRPQPLTGLHGSNFVESFGRIALSPGYRFPSDSLRLVSSNSGGVVPLNQYPPLPWSATGIDESEIDTGNTPTLATHSKRWLSEEKMMAGAPGSSVATKPFGNQALKCTRPKVTVASPSFSEVKNIPSFNSPYHDRDESTDYLPSGLSTPGGSDENSDDDYDWSGEEDLVDQQAKFVSQFGPAAKREGWGFKRIVQLLSSTLVGSSFLATLLIIPPLVVHFYWYKPHPTERRRFVDKTIQAWMFWGASNIVISWLLAMLIDIAPIVIRYFLIATWGDVSEYVKSNLEIYHSVKDTAKPAFYAASALASWDIIFSHIYGMHSVNETVPSAVPYTDRVYQVVLFFFFLTLVLCVQKMISHFVAYNFHRLAYQERIDDVQTALDVIDKLKRYQPKAHRWNPSSAQNSFQNDWQKTHAKMLNEALKRQAHKSTKAPFSTGTGGSNTGSDVDEDRRFACTEGQTRSPAVLSSDQDSPGEVEERHIHYRPQHRHFWSKHKDKETSSSLDLLANRSHSQRGGGDSVSTQEEIPLEELSPTFKSHRCSPPLYRPQHVRTHTGTSTSGGRQANFSPSGMRGTKTPEAAGAAIVQAAKILKKAVLHDARNLQRHEDSLASLSWNINSTREAKRLARSIFRKLRDRHRKYLVAADFYPAFSTREEAEKAFHIFDSDANGDLSRAEIKIKLVKTYQERRFLSRSLKDVGDALKTLNRILRFFALVILFFISLSVFGVSIGDSLSSVYTLCIAASFIFKNSASNAFDAIMFLFVSHPYDTGDRIFVDEENLVVKKVGLFATVFSRSDGTQTYYFNSQLFNKFITNARRSGKTTENLEMHIHWKTPLERLDALETALNEWLSTEEKRWFQPSTGVTLQHIEYQRYLKLTIGIPHNSNWQDWALHNARKTAFYAAVQYYCNQLGITGYEAPIPVVFDESDALLAAQTCNLDDDPEPHASERATSGLYGHVGQPQQPFQPALGFVPPDNKFANLARARKSHRSRKHHLGAMNAEC